MPLNICSRRNSAKSAAVSASKSGICEQTSQITRYVRFFGWAILITAYGFLVPGLILPLYYYSLQGQTVYKTMWTTIDLVYQTGGIFSAILLAFFGIAVPAIKLLLVGIAHFRNIPLASKLVVWVSKWAIVDAIVACFIMAYYANAMDGAVIARVDTGFMCFATYCILSTLAALILDDRDLDFKTMYASRRLLKTQEWLDTKLPSIVALVVTGTLTIAALFLDTVEIGMKPEIVPLSVISACSRLATELNADTRPLVLIVLFVIMVPLAELVFLSVLVAKPTDSFSVRCALRCIPQCGLLDVYTVSVLVMYIFLNQLGMVTVVIPPSGFTVLCLALASTLATRFVVGRYLSTHFGAGALNQTIEAKNFERTPSSTGESTISSGNTVIATVV